MHPSVSLKHFSSLKVIFFAFQIIHNPGQRPKGSYLGLEKNFGAIRNKLLLTFV
jgi:hypothetical protein